MLRGASNVKIIRGEQGRGKFERTKGSGVGKLARSLKDNFLGVSRAKIQTILNEEISHYRQNAKFLLRRG